MPLVAYRRSVITTDTAEAMRKLEQALAQVGGARLEYKGVRKEESSWEHTENWPGPTDQAPDRSMRPTGREVYLRVVSEHLDKQEALNLLWAKAVPLGFMPWNRYPTTGPGATCFHYFGEWKQILEFLHGNGEGEYAWPSVCCAAQLEVGTWEGGRAVEREVQALLTMVGFPCGPIDGIIGPRTASSLKAMGLLGKTMVEALPVLRSLRKALRQSKENRPAKKKQLFLSVPPGSSAQVYTSGGVAATQSPAGYAITHTEAGKLILLLGD
jgi:hypothetical protein